VLVGAVVALGLAAMAVDHLLGDDPGLEDPPMFLISAAVILVIAAPFAIAPGGDRTRQAGTWTAGDCRSGDRQCRAPTRYGRVHLRRY
jgi:hypothetical protein